MSVYVIGLTGGIACGKSNLSAALRTAGARIIDADQVSHALTAPGGAALPAIRAAFGDEVFAGNALNRQALGTLVFGDEKVRARLNAIVHPLVFQEMRRQLDACTGAAVLDVPLLFECGMDTWCDEIWCAYLPQREQVKRLMARDGLTRAEALRRIRSQMPTREKARRADRVIRTDGSREQSAQIVLSLWRSLPPTIRKEKGERP